MSMSQSFLSDGRYGYDFVVATTQASINKAMKQFLSKKTEPEVTICWQKEPGNPVYKIVEYETLLDQAKGSDPFKIPANANPETNPDLINLKAAKFRVGIRARIGIPPGYAPTKVPDYIQLGADTSQVTWNLMCSEFLIAQYIPGEDDDPATWVSVSQPAGNAWLFTSKVDLTFQGTAWDALPAEVKEQLKNKDANAFSVQQLIFDLSNARLQSVPTLPPNITGPAVGAIKDYFLVSYFAKIQQAGGAIAGCVVKPKTPDNSSLSLTDFEFKTMPLLNSNTGKPFENPSPEQLNAGMLNYLCATNSDPLPSPVAFTWNWLDPAENAAADGVIAINRNTLAKYFRDKQSLKSYAAENCYSVWVRVNLTDAGFTTNYHWKLTRNQSPTTELPTSGSVVLKYSFDSGEAQDDAGLKGDMGELKLRSTFDMTVSFVGDTIVIRQRIVVWGYMRSLQTHVDGNLVDKTITDTYTISVDANGRLVTSMASAPEDHSEDPSTNGFLNLFTGANDLIDSLKSSVRNITSTALHDIPLSIVQDFVFPGGKTFIFKDGRFSDNQDLVAHISYADPPK